MARFGPFPPIRALARRRDTALQSRDQVNLRWERYGYTARADPRSVVWTKGGCASAWTRCDPREWVLSDGLCSMVKILRPHHRQQHLHGILGRRKK